VVLREAAITFKLEFSLKFTKGDPVNRSKLTLFTQSILIIVSATYLQPATAADSAEHIRQMQEHEKVANNIYKAYFPDLDIAHKAAITFHAQLLESNYESGYLVFELTPQEMLQLRQFGFKLKPATEFMEQRKKFLNDVQAETLRLQQSAPADARVAAVVATTIPSFPCYETVEETFNQAANFVINKPNLATLLDVGDSWEKTANLGGYDIKVLKLTNSAIIGLKPRLFINSAIHAREYATAPLNLEFARWLLNGYGVNADATWILDHHEVHLMLHTNPDGRKKAEAGLSWRKNTNQAYCGATSNTRGADLNRNFSFTYNTTGGLGSSGNQCDITYRGVSPGSEPETQAIEAYVRSLWPDQRGSNLTDAALRTNSGIHIDLHSYSQLVLWPWGTTSAPAGNGVDLQTLGRKLAFFNGYTPKQSNGLYPTDGTSDSVSYGELGVAAYTIELGTSFFQSCNTYNNTIKPNNLNALIYAAKVVRTPYITPSGPDISALSLGGTASTTGVQVGTTVSLTGTVNATRYNNTNGIQPTQNIVAAEYYIDTPPWVIGATPITLIPGDGSFNTKTEAIKGSINTSGLSVGKHMVYVRGLDVANNWGAISAVFLQINP
jgi:carboxypeptidase T